MRLLLIALLLLSGCGLYPSVLREEIGALGSFEYRAAGAVGGVVIGAPYAQSEPLADRIARATSIRTGAGLATGHGFKAKKLAVTQPIVKTRPFFRVPASPVERGSVFREYKEILRAAAGGSVDLYIGIRAARERNSPNRIEVATSGLSFEQAAALKDAYVAIRDEHVRENHAVKLDLAIEPVDPISWSVHGVKHHGVLMTARKGLNVRLPDALALEPAEAIYTEILCRWIDAGIRMLRDKPWGTSDIHVRLESLGRFELMHAQEIVPNTVIGSPHGSFDQFTAEIARRISHQTGIAAVIAKGFTPTEAGGWRINVNRPTEKLFPSEDLELHTSRAREVYASFKELVLTAADGRLRLYIDMHQYNTDAQIQVATVGVSAAQARVIKMIYERVRNLALESHPRVPAAELLIEPLDAVPMGAWTAKNEGILGVAEMALHFELPTEKTLYGAEARAVYAQILGDIFREAVPFLLTSPRSR